MFFCGNEPDCIEFNSARALKKAMAVVEEEFSVVGILENLPETFSVFEKYVPRFFKNIKTKSGLHLLLSGRRCDINRGSEKGGREMDSHRQ